MELPALQIQPPANPLAQYAQVQQIRGAQQEQQLRAQQMQSQNLQLEQQQQAQESQQALMKAYKEANGNLEQAVPLAAKYGATPQDLLKLKQASIESQKQNIDLLNAKGARALQEADLMQGGHDQVMKAPPEQRPMVYQQTLQALQHAGIDVSQMPPQYPGDQQFEMMGVGLKGHKQGLEEAAKQLENSKTIAQTGEANAKAASENATAATNKQKADWYAKQGLAPGVSVEEAGMADWLKKNPGKGPSDYQIAMKKVVPAFNFNLQQNAGGPKLTDPAMDQAAQRYLQTGQLPPGGRGTAAIIQNRAIMNRAAELGAGQDISTNKAILKANSDSLAKLQSQFDNVSAFEKTANANIEVLKGTLKDIPDLGSKFANVPARMLSDRLIGTPAMAKYKTALATVQPEAAKILNSANASGVLSDSARHELESVINGNATVPAMLVTLETLQKDFGNRHQAYQEQIADIKGRLPGGKSGSSQNTPPPSTGGFDWNAHPKAN